MEKRSVSKSCERRAFWEKHVKAQALSGLSRVDYCKKYDLNYHRANYWFRKIQSTSISSFIPVTVKETTTESHCHITLPNGAIIHIQSLEAFSLILKEVLL